MEIPDIPAKSYGLSITPVEDGGREALKDRMKVLKFGVIGKRTEHISVMMNVSNLLIKAKE
jgi:hypothetical protein